MLNLPQSKHDKLSNWHDFITQRAKSTYTLTLMGIRVDIFTPISQQQSFSILCPIRYHHYFLNFALKNIGLKFIFKAKTWLKIILPSRNNLDVVSMWNCDYDLDYFFDMCCFRDQVIYFLYNVLIWFKIQKTYTVHVFANLSPVIEYCH